ILKRPAPRVDQVPGNGPVGGIPTGPTAGNWSNASPLLATRARALANAEAWRLDKANGLLCGLIGLQCSHNGQDRDTRTEAEDQRGYASCCQWRGDGGDRPWPSRGTYRAAATRHPRPDDRRGEGHGG